MRILTIFKKVKNNKIEIHSVDQDWFRLAPPEGGLKQWVDLHSAKELAKYFIHSGGFVPKEIDDYLSQIGADETPFVAEPEKITSLCKDGFGANGPRHHDLLMWNHQMVVGLEAKATETLDQYVTEKVKGNMSNNQKLRYPGLCKRLLGKEFEECSDIRYQLLSATAGTLIEAKKRKLDSACLLILLFNTPTLVSKEHIDLTRKDIEVFVNQLKKNSDGSCRTIEFLSDIRLFVELLIVDTGSYK